METTQTPIISIRNLRKSYGATTVLHGIDLDIYPGRVIGYIGPNGAGKSTTVRILAGLDGQFEGDIRIGDIDVKADPIAVKKMIGYIPENATMYDVLTPMEFLNLIGKLHHLSPKTITERATGMLNYFGMSKHLNDRMNTFSKGMRQKVLLVSGLLHNPEIIFLDEPLSGLDANTVMMVKEIIARLAAQGKTIFYCSHMMDVVEKISDRIILINGGRIVADDTFEALQGKVGTSLEQVFSQLTGSVDHVHLADEFLQNLSQKTEE